MTHPQNARDLLCKEKAEAFWLEAAALVLDHAIYSKALETLLKEGNEALKTFMNLGMGGFHACFLFFAVIWKHFGDAGLKDLIIESVLHLGDGTVEQIMKGKQYNNTIRIHNVVPEAVTRKKVDAFTKWLIQNGDIDKLHYFIFSNELKVLQTDPNAKSFEACVSLAEEITNLLDEFEKFISDGHVSPMASFWQPYVEMFVLLL